MFMSHTLSCPCCFSFFFFNDTATTEIYTLSLHDALPIYRRSGATGRRPCGRRGVAAPGRSARHCDTGCPQDRRRRSRDRKSTRLNSSHSQISYAVFCLKKKKKLREPLHPPTHTAYDRCIC